MRHVLLGGNGYLGRELARMLIAEGENVHVADLAPALVRDLPALPYTQANISEPAQLHAIPLGKDDVVHHLASKLLVPNRPRFGRDAYFAVTNVTGTKNVLRWMADNRASRMVFWSTDMVYGPALMTPRTEEHPRLPFGAYGRSKVIAENMVMAARGDGMQITVLRPRLIVGPGRLGILERLFWLIAHNLPVPLIGDGRNRFQFISVSDCARASIMSVRRRIPNTEINLGSADPPRVYDLLSQLIDRANSRSALIRTPGSFLKAVLRLLHALTISPMDPEQFMIADHDIVLDINRAREVLGWTPKDSDGDMLFAAYDTYRRAST